MKFLKKLSIYLIVLTVAVGCKFKYVDEQKFIGVWELKGKNNFDGLRVSISRNGNLFSGKIVQLPNNDRYKLFMMLNETWITNIERTSNYEFKLTQKKIAGELFSEYGLSDVVIFKAQILSEDKIGLAENNGDPEVSELYYKRVDVSN